MDYKRYNLLLTVLVVLFMMTAALNASILNSVKGTVTDKESSEPLDGVKVTLTFGSLNYYVSTDAKGYFYKSGLKNGAYQVKYEKAGYIPAVANFRLRISQTRDISVVLRKLKVEKPVEPSLLQKGTDKLNAGQYEDAIKLFNEAIAKQPDNPVVYYYRGFCLYKTGQQDPALADFLKSLEIDPELTISLAEAGKIYAKKNQLDEAVKYYKKAYELGITDDVALYNYGVCLYGLGNNEEALKVYEKLLSLDPNYADAYYQVGLIYVGLGDNAKAKENLQKFLELDPENSNASVATEILKTI